MRSRPVHTVQGWHVSVWLKFSEKVSPGRRGEVKKNLTFILRFLSCISFKSIYSLCTVLVGSAPMSLFETTRQEIILFIYSFSLQVLSWPFFFFLNREMIHLSGNNFIIVCMWFFKLNHTFSYCAHSGFDAFHPSNCRSEDHLSCFNHFLLIFISLFLPPLIYLRLSQLSASSRTLLLHYFDIFFKAVSLALLYRNV